MKSPDWFDLVDASGGPDACWPWMGSIHSDGYAQGYFSDEGGRWLIARWSLGLRLGRRLASHEWALHTCDNRRCVNPAHLYVGDAVDNGHDRAVRGRARNAYTVLSLGRVSPFGPEAA